MVLLAMMIGVIWEIFFFYDMLLVNILYRKGKEHLITFKNISNWSKIDFFLEKLIDPCLKDIK